jgi:hypothetical protein
MLYQNPRLSDRELKYIWLKRQRVDHLSSCLASCAGVRIEHAHIRGIHFVRGLKFKRGPTQTQQFEHRLNTNSCRQTQHKYV